VHVYARTLPAAVVTLVLGAATLSAVGLAVATLVRSADQATPIAQLTFLPVSFISGIWFPLEGAPHWVTTVAGIFPLEHIVRAFDRAFSPGVAGGAWSPHDLWSIAVWGAVATFVQANLADVGINVKIQQTEFPALRALQTGGQFDIALDGLILKAQQTSSEADRKALYFKVQEEIMAKVPGAFLFSPKLIVFARANVEGLVVNSAPPLNEYWSVYKK